FGALANLPVGDPLLRGVVARFFLLPHLLLCAAAGLAVTWTRHRATWLAPLGVLLLGVTGAPKHDGAAVHRYGEWLLAQSDDTLVLTKGDLIGNATRALQACEGVHRELRVVDQELLTFAWYPARLTKTFPELKFPGERWHPREPGAFTLDQWLAANASRPIVVCGDLKEGDPTTWQRLPWGLCERLAPPNAPVDVEAWFTEASRRLPDVTQTSATAPRGSWEELVRRDAWQAKARLGLWALTVGMARGDDVTWLHRAHALLVEASRDEVPQAAVFKNLGIAAGRLAPKEPALQDEMKRAFRRYLELAPPGDPELPTIRALAQ
ncbi:MAG: hypothetical protein ACOZQL_00005, partial [Myxococcota bacterium]